MSSVIIWSGIATSPTGEYKPYPHGTATSAYSAGLAHRTLFFSANKDWIPYERLQAEVFDHVLAVLPQFGLKVFQSPTGTDILALSKQ